MKLGMGLPNQIRHADPAIIPDWAARAEKQIGADDLTLTPTTDPDEIERLADLLN